MEPFLDEKTRSVIDRFYYLGDWVDEYCDLTLDKMVNETKSLGQRDIIRTIKTPEDIQELKEQLKSLNSRGDTYVIEAKEKKAGFFDNVKTFFSRKKK